MVMCLLVLIGSTACRTSVVDTEKESRQIIASMLPKAPELPSFPTLYWTYKDGLYGLSESDVDLLLDFGENSLAEFAFDYSAWQSQVEVIINKLI